MEGYNPNYQEFGVPVGWRCPQCKKILSPHMSFCPFCESSQKTWTSPTINDSEWWNEYLKQNTTGHPSTFYEDLNKTISTAKKANINNITTGVTADIQQEVRTGAGQATTTTDKNVVITAWNNFIEEDTLDSLIKHFQD